MNTDAFNAYMTAWAKDQESHPITWSDDTHGVADWLSNHDDGGASLFKRMSVGWEMVRHTEDDEGNPVRDIIFVYHDEGGTWRGTSYRESDELEEGTATCDSCGEVYPFEGCGEKVIMGCCELCDRENVCGYCSMYNEEKGMLACTDCAERNGWGEDSEEET